MNSGKDILTKNIQELLHSLNTFIATEKAMDNFEEIVELCISTIKNGNIIYFVGNGGSAADSQHIAAEFVARFKLDRQAIPALALTTDMSNVTAIANDYDFSQIFSRQLQALGRSGDILFCLSTSGNSENVINAAKCASVLGAKSVAVTGNINNRLMDHCDFHLVVDSDQTSSVQEAYLVILHSLCEAVELKLFKGNFDDS